MSNRNLATQFLEAPACKTLKGVEARIAKIQGLLDKEDIPYSVVQRTDGLFIAVAIVSDRTSWAIHALIAANVCVTSA